MHGSARGRSCRQNGILHGQDKTPHPHPRGDRTSLTAKISAAQTQRRVLELRLAGATFAVIAEAVGLSLSAAYKVFYRAMRDITHEAAGELRTLELARLDEMQMRLMHRLRQDDFSVVNGLLGVMDRRARLLALYDTASAGNVDTAPAAAVFAAMLHAAQAFAESYTPPADPDGV